MLNRVGLTMDEAWSERPPYEVEALLLSQVAQREVAMDRSPRHDIPIMESGGAAPGWVDDLPVEEG